MSRLPFVSVVIPTRNRAKLIGHTVECVLAQDYPPELYEVIVVDDGSSDATPEIVRSYGERSGQPYATYVRRDPVTANAARNEGVRRARGDPIVFLDDDIDAPPSWLRALVDGSLRHPEASCFGGPIRLRIEGVTPRFCGRERFGDTELDLGDEDAPADLVWSANMAIRRSAFNQVGLFDEALVVAGDEEEWELRLKEAGGIIYYIPEAWLWHRRVQDDLHFMRMLRGRFRRGRHQVKFARAIGRRYTVGTELAAIGRSLAHAARRFCAAGLLSASIQAGRIWELLDGRTADPRTSDT